MLKFSQNLQASIFDIFRKHHITGDHGVPLGGIGYGIHIHKNALKYKILYFNVLTYKPAGTKPCISAGSIGRSYKGEFQQFKLFPKISEEAPILTNQFSVSKQYFEHCLVSSV